MIPEFVGRLPIMVTLDALDEDGLVRVLKEPKNALTKQYKKLFEMDGVDLEFQEDALRVAAKEALERKTGARGLRAIFEELMLDTMYDLPSREDVSKCIVTKESLENHTQPLLITKGTDSHKEIIA